jgi:hypothetical protein
MTGLLRLFCTVWRYYLLEVELKFKKSLGVVRWGLADDAEPDCGAA